MYVLYVISLRNIDLYMYRIAGRFSILESIRLVAFPLVPSFISVSGEWMSLAVSVASEKPQMEVPDLYANSIFVAVRP